MLIKFESKSNRVKGISFHPTRPWILASLHNGTIQLWDYRMGTLVDKYDQHEGPVRGISFHSSQPLFVSGGDDYKIKVWNYKSSKCLFTLTGHLDYIRTVQFHHNYPWIISASDDQTIRIWNWQNRSCLSVLTGHNHYVMCAQFHPKEDLIVSASLDQTVRVWDISGLRRKQSQAPTSEDNKDIFGNTDAITKYILEGHERGVNWASFHPTLPLIVSGADDRQVKIWRMSETKAWELDACRGHYNNVSCVIFHPKQELILSNSEDKSIRVWDMQKRTAIQTFRRENDRFWVMQSHPSDSSLFAAGHDSGLIVFKLERERPCYDVVEGRVYYIRDKSIYCENEIIGQLSRQCKLNQLPRVMSVSSSGSVLVGYNQDTSGIDVYQSGSQSGSQLSGGTIGLFISRSKFVVLCSGGSKLQVYSSTSTTTSQLKTEINLLSITGNNQVLSIHSTSTSTNKPGHVLLVTLNTVYLYDVNNQQLISTLPTNSQVKYTATQSKTTLALLTKHTIYIVDASSFKLIETIHETIRIKSGLFIDDVLLLYTTLNHCKFYIRGNSSSNIVCTLATPLYLVDSKSLHEIRVIDRSATLSTLSIDPTEFLFKLALHSKQYDRVLDIIKSSDRLVGQSIISYLRKKGYQELCLLFVRDINTRFELALECGDLSEATDAAIQIDTRAVWYRLSERAIQMGQLSIVEESLRRVGDYGKLSLLYFVSGRGESIERLIKETSSSSDTVLYLSLLINDYKSIISVFKRERKYLFAAMLAHKYGLEEEIEEVERLSGRKYIPSDQSSMRIVDALRSRMRVVEDWNWPLVVSKSQLGGGKSDFVVKDTTTTTTTVATTDATDAPTVEDNWNVDLDDLNIPTTTTNTTTNATTTTTTTTVNTTLIPTRGPSSTEHLIRLNTPHSLVVAGEFELAMRLIAKSCSVVDMRPLKGLFMRMYESSRMYVDTNLPLIIQSQSDESGSLEVAHMKTTQGLFSDAIDEYRGRLQSLVFSSSSESVVKEEKRICVEYIVGLSMEAERRRVVVASSSNDSNKRAVELAAYFSECQLLSEHKILALKVAMVQAYKVRCFKMASVFARRMLEMCENDKARQLIVACEGKDDEIGDVDYDYGYYCGVDCGSYKMLSGGSGGDNVVECLYCGAKYCERGSGGVCVVCCIGKVE